MNRFVAFALLIRLSVVSSTCAAVARLGVEAVAGPMDPGITGVEFRGVEAGEFKPQIWQHGQLNLLPDVRFPMLEPQAGRFRNLYAPSAVQLASHSWRFFYGGWDGSPTPNDRIYSAVTNDFITFTDRHTVIEHGALQHINNVNALRLLDGSYAMFGTAFPDSHGRNKPAFFSSPDGTHWNGSAEPHAAKASDLISITGYSNYATADINGANVLVRENKADHLYFWDFKNAGKVFRASSSDGRAWTYDGVAMDNAPIINDAKVFFAEGSKWYLLALHFNRGELFYSISTDSMHFPAPQVLLKSLNSDDRFMTSVGWVVEGQSESQAKRVLGVAYGAGAAGTLDKNRIFARWLQKKIVVHVADGSSSVGNRAYGPNAQQLPWHGTHPASVSLYSEDGETLIAQADSVTLAEGSVYQLKLQ